MTILVVGFICLIAFFLVVRWIGASSDRMLKQYTEIEKRFRLNRKEFRDSRFGAGVGTRLTLTGEYRGYHVSLYGHYRKVDGRRASWTSLVFETLFAEEIEFDLFNRSCDRLARFPENPRIGVVDTPFCDSGFVFASSDASVIEADPNGTLEARFQRFAESEKSGAVRLSKGFLEYRECGDLDSDEARIRYQDAFLLLADLADAVSVFKESDGSR